MQTMKELRDRLLQLSAELDSGKTDLKTAGEIHNGIGKIINTVRAQLEYAKLRKEKPKIDFMDCH